MPKSKFSIERVDVEGFKAFTERQSFDFGGRHVFLFGQNGLGKTSIVEAIRWCLFGLASRPGEVIKNQFYGKSCTVILTLKGPDGFWTLQRWLRATGGASDLTVRDPSGKERNLEEVFPQLSRIGPREGTHVIYAAQQPSSRRPEADITDFSYVVFRYLGLEEVPRLSDALLKLDEEWEPKEDDLLSSVNELDERFSERIKQVESQVDQIISNPPWGQSITPDSQSTSNRIDTLVTDAELLGAECSSEDLQGLESSNKLYEIETALSAFFSDETSDLQGKLDKNTQMLQQANTLLVNGRKAEEALQELSGNLATVQKELACILNGSTLEELEKQVHQLDSESETAQQMLDVVRSSRRYMLSLDEEDTPQHECPTCNTEVQVSQLKLRLEEVESDGDADTKDLLQRRDDLSELVSKAKTLSSREADFHSAINRNKDKIKKVLSQATEQLGFPGSVSLESLGDFVAKMKKACKGLQNAIESKSEIRQSWETRTENLRQEIRYQRLRTLRNRLQRLRDDRFAKLDADVKDLGTFRDVVRQLRDKVNTELNRRLDEELPPVGEEMSKVYLRLTGNPTFDSISVHRGYSADGAVALDLKVSSTRGAGAWGVDNGILNGQALNAIQLVPYFVFSRYQEGPLLDLLLLDDPTQAFDAEKIELLLRELSDATSHATLLVATHEEDRFLPYLKQHFPSDSVVAYRAREMDENGPRIENVPIGL